MFLNQTQNSSKQQVSHLSWRKRGFQLKNMNTRLVIGHTVATQAKLASFSEFCKRKGEPLRSLPNLLLFGAEGSAGLQNLPNLPFSEFRSQSNTNPRGGGDNYHICGCDFRRQMEHPRHPPIEVTPPPPREKFRVF